MPSTVTDRLYGENSSLAIKAPVVAVSQGANLALSGLVTLGGYTTQEGDRVLVKDQADATQNGIYNASVTAWQRSGDFDGNYDVTQGTLVLVNLVSQPGTALLYQLTAANPITIGSSQITFTPFVNPQQSWPQTAGEGTGGVAPTNTAYPPTFSLRYGAVPNPNPAGNTDDATAALRNWIDAAWAMYNYSDTQGLWNGGGGIVPIATLSPGKYKVSGSITLPSGITVCGEAHPANTVSHTRIIMNSTGTTPGAQWSALTNITTNQLIVPTVANGYYYQANNSGVFLAGETGNAQPVWPLGVGLQVVDSGVTWTCAGLTAAGDNRNTPMLKLSRATVPGGNVLQNQSWNGTLERLEFWEVTEGNNFGQPLGPGGGIPFGSYPLGALLYIDCDVADTRIVSCCFQNSPCAIRIHNAKPGQVASDGFMNHNQVVLYVEECEFDAAGAHVYADNSALDLTFRNCSFFGSIHKYVGCTGTVRYINCRFFGGAFIDASDSGNAFTVFQVKGSDMDQYNGADTLSVYGATLLDVKGITFAQAATPYSTIVANTCSSGGIDQNSINDSGFNTTFTAGGITAAAAIKMIDCQNMGVRGNNITATDTGATYGGFGILTLGSGRGSKNNFIDGNAVSAPYTGAQYNSQNRAINLANTTDMRGVNYTPAVSTIPRRGPVAKLRQAPAYSASITFDASSGDEFDITVTNTNAFTVNNPTNPTEGQEIAIMVRNTSGGALGAITWGAAFKINGTALSPTNGSSQSINFRYDGVNWVELWRGAFNIPN